MTKYRTDRGWQAIEGSKALIASGYRAVVRSLRSTDADPDLNGWFIITDADETTIATHIASIT